MRPAIDAEGTLTFTPGNEPTLATVTVTATDDGGLEDWGWLAYTSEPPDDTSEPVTFEIVIWGPGAVDDEVTIPEDSGWLVDVLANDNGGSNPVTVVEASDGAKGTVEVFDDAVVYWPAQDATGTDSSTYTIADSAGRRSHATVEVTITPVNDDPVAADDTFTVDEGAGPAVDVLANDTDVDGDELSVTAAGPAGHGTVVLNGGVVRYWPDTGFSGVDTFDYSVDDGHGGSDAATVTFTVPANEPPIATDDDLEVEEDTLGVVAVLANDHDPDDDPLAVVDHGTGTKGSVLDGNNNELWYHPYDDATGSDQFTYTVSDGHGGTAEGTVHVTIVPVNDPPVAADDELEVSEGAVATTVDVLGNDDDDDGDVLVIEAAGPAEHGTVELADGSLTYRPAPAFSGSDGFAYTVVDGHGGSDTGSVSVTVSADTMPPSVAAGAVAVAGSTLGRSTVRLRFRWSASDGGSGIASQAVRQRRPGGTWRVVERPAPGVGAIVASTEPGRVEAWRVRATDLRGNVSPWAAWPEVEATVRQETASSIAWSGTWKRGTDRADSGGATRWTGGAGRRASVEVRARAVAGVGGRDEDGGRAEVWVDGVHVATVDTDAAAGQHRAVLFRTAWADKGLHRIELRTLGGGRVDVDAFVIVRRPAPLRSARPGEVAEWQTRRSQTPLTARSCGFESHLRYQRPVPPSAAALGRLPAPPPTPHAGACLEPLPEHLQPRRPGGEGHPRRRRTRRSRRRWAAPRPRASGSSPPR